MHTCADCFNVPGLSGWVGSPTAVTAFANACFSVSLCTRFGGIRTGLASGRPVQRQHCHGSSCPPSFKSFCVWRADCQACAGGIPCGCMMACFVFKANCQPGYFCLEGDEMVTACAAAFFAHIALHTLLLLGRKFIPIYIYIYFFVYHNSTMSFAFLHLLACRPGSSGSNGM